jgi:hypothetical protein
MGGIKRPERGDFTQPARTPDGGTLLTMGLLAQPDIGGRDSPHDDRVPSFLTGGLRSRWAPLARSDADRGIRLTMAPTSGERGDFAHDRDPAPPLGSWLRRSLRVRLGSPSRSALALLNAAFRVLSETGGLCSRRREAAMRACFVRVMAKRLVIRGSETEGLRSRSPRRRRGDFAHKVPAEGSGSGEGGTLLMERGDFAHAGIEAVSRPKRALVSSP